MDVRPRNLEEGWYPSEAKDVRSTVSQWESELEAAPKQDAGAGIAPHAGWFFSGRLAWDTLRRARPDTETVVVAGGHRPEGTSVLIAREKAFETPLGLLPADEELARALEAHVSVESDRWADNTVEVFLPLVKLRFPKGRAVWLRVPNDMSAEKVGASVARAAGELGRKVFFLASTDLTHYGPNYSFSPLGTGEAAYDWVKNVNDKGIVEAFLAQDAREAIRRGNEERAACSPGAAVAAIGFAQAMGFMGTNLCGYYTSRDIYPAESFVGYCSVVYG